MMEYLAYPAAIFMGILLGLIGGGGAMLTLPVLVYLMHYSSGEATSYSLFIVGVAALVAVTDYVRNQLICWRSVVVFGVPSITFIWLVRTQLVPRIPAQLCFGSVALDKDLFILVLFALLMLISSLTMIRPLKVIRQEEYREAKRYRYVLILIGGMVVGAIAGLLGAGGGFLIIPALVVLANLPMKKAIGTSLALVFINSAIGFSADLIHGIQPDWNFLILFTAFAVLGIGIGLWISRRISGAKLKPTFGWFVLVLGIFILIKSYYEYKSPKPKTHVYRATLYQLPS
jgi:uncharacterized protein